MSIRHLLLSALVVSVGALTGCGGGGGGGGGTGTLNVKITDAPFPIGQVKSAVVNVVSVEARGDSGWVDVPIVDGGPALINLYELTGGLSEQLALAEVPTGSYDEIRLVIDMAKLTFVVDGPVEVTQDFLVPSGASSGIKVKIDPPVMVAQNLTSDVMLDVDLSASFHVTGVGGEPTWDDLVGAKAIFHPVIHAINEAKAALLVGLVVDEEMLPLGNVEVSAFPAGTTFTPNADETLPDVPSAPAGAVTFSTPEGMEAAFGSYALFLEPGSYDVYLRMQESNVYLSVRTDLLLAVGDALTEDLILPLP